ncbi:hypothetical protein LVQ78_05840 [Buttiauxella sp. A2-C2_NF]|jgi:cytoskeletal protein CcmA (bactofilin family)|uniref:hypothetical protein n=1 Tax=Buttiauxella ferragutiae TaxID=82989 RepID=UPI001E36E1A3|nr:hypothetical protein [Buttiauxella ferragutiae]MCE0825551.1 hypothetical protein [Buttiauxella ferragutiae]UNK62462.1 hypothetical protein MNO13_05830 [Buttiauxella ferragutiae]
MVKPFITQHAQFEFSLGLLHGIQSSLIALEKSLEIMDSGDVKAAISANRFVVSGVSEALIELQKWEMGK